MKKIFYILVILSFMINSVIPCVEVNANQSEVLSSKTISAPTEKQAYDRMIALKNQYPEGTSWTNSNGYFWQGAPIQGYGCAAFAFMLSDAAFGDRSAYRFDTINYDALKVGDILRMNNDSHSVIILEKNADHIVIAEGNYNFSVHWGRVISKAEVLQSDYYYTRYPDPISITGVSLDKSELTLKPGGMTTLRVITQPSNANDVKKTFWELSMNQPGVVEIESINGGLKVQALKPGIAYITVIINDKYRASCKVTVSSDMKMSAASRIVTVGKSTVLSVSPKQNVTWRIGNSNIATVDKYGKVTGKSVGSTWVYAKAADGSEVRASIKVIPQPTSVKLNYSSKIVTVGKTTQFKATVNPTNANQAVTWRSSNTRIATVDKNGLVTAKSAGTAYIYAKTINGKEIRATVKVIPQPTGVKLNYSSKIVTQGKTTQFKATVNPTNANQAVTWRSHNTKVATVDKNGIVTAKSVGTAYIYAKTINGKEIRATVKVIPQPKSVKINTEKQILKIGRSCTLKATVNPTNANQAVTWRIGNSKIATVDKNGRVTGKSEGLTWLYAKTVNGIETRSLIKVTK